MNIKKKLQMCAVILIAFCCHSNGYSQATQAGLGIFGHTAGAGGVPVRYVDWDATAASNAIPLSVEHRGTNNINFFTGATQRMTILGTVAGATQGFVGIGTNFIAPLHLFDVRDGDINVGSGTAGNIANSNEAYRIGGNRVLWHNGITTSIFVGVGTGNVGPNNTFVGNLAGAASTGVATARRNTFVGSRAGENCDIGDGNVSVGDEAGLPF